MQDILEKANDYRLRAHRKARAHYLAGKASHARHVQLGVPVVVTTTIVGTTIFATLSKAQDMRWQIATGLLSILAAALAALQTFFRYAEEAEKHRATAASYSALYRRFDLFLLKNQPNPAPDRDAAIRDLEALVEIFNQLEEKSLDVQDSYYDQAVKEQNVDKDGV